MYVPCSIVGYSISQWRLCLSLAHRLLEHFPLFTADGLVVAVGTVLMSCTRQAVPITDALIAMQPLQLVTWRVRVCRR
jgi:hypothetical protein